MVVATKKKNGQNPDLAFDRRQVLSGLETLADLWERMDTVVQAEWKLLLDHDLTRLIKLSRIKENLVRKIKDEEDGFRLMASCFLPQLFEKEGMEAEGVLEGALGHRGARRFLLLLRKRDYFKQIVHATNKRILYWLEERSSFVDELTSILSGRQLESGPTYTPPRRNAKKPHHLGMERIEQGLELSGLQMDEIKKGVAGYAKQIKFKSSE